MIAVEFVARGDSDAPVICKRAPRLGYVALCLTPCVTRELPTRGALKNAVFS